MNKNEVKGDFTELNKLISSIPNAEDYIVQVGVLEAKAYPDSDLNTAEVGAKHEFGSPKENIPQRSFLREPLEDKQEQIVNVAGKYTLEFIRQNKTKELLEKIGIEAVGIVNEAFLTGGFGKWKPLTEKTIKEKKARGSRVWEKPLIRDEFLLQSIMARVIKK